MILQSLREMVEALDQAGVPYCHWKGNFSLDRVLSGEKDFELLVERESLGQVMSVLLRLGYKRAFAQGEDLPSALAHYYVYDWPSGRWAHIHLYSRLLTGESFIKSHLLPFEGMLLWNVEHLGAVRVPTKSAELVSHTLRMLIKYGSLLDLLYLFREEGDNRAALAYLQDGASVETTLCLLRQYCPAVDEQLFLRCLDTLQASRSVLAPVGLARQVRRQLRGYECMSGLERLVAYGKLSVQYVARRLRGRRPNKFLQSGGAVIAFVGPEATGKSTLVRESGQWLGETFMVRVVHAGKPPSSWLTRPVNLFVPLLRRLRPDMRTTRVEGCAADCPGGNGIRSLPYALRAVLVAWDRYRLLTRCWRWARNGEIVLCDRYPSDEVGAMDSARLREDPAARGWTAVIYNRLARLERQLYRQIPPPDLALRLSVSIETAKQRNRERVKVDKESDGYVESRHRRARAWHRAGTRYVHDIDTERPLPETLMNVKQCIWESL